MDKQLNQLESHLQQLLTEHESLLSLVRRKQQAMREANARLVGDCCELENERVQKIGEIEKTRQLVVAELTEMLAPGAAKPLTVGQIAEHLDEPRRGRVLVIQTQLVRVIGDVRKESAITRAAMERLLNHVNGMVQTIVKTVGGATYGRGGMVSAAPSLVSSFSATV